MPRLDRNFRKCLPRCDRLGWVVKYTSKTQAVEEAAVEGIAVEEITVEDADVGDAVEDKSGQERGAVNAIRGDFFHHFILMLARFYVSVLRLVIKSDPRQVL